MKWSKVVFIAVIMLGFCTVLLRVDRYVRAQSEGTETGSAVKCMALTGIFESCPSVTITSDVHDCGDDGVCCTYQCYGEYYWACIPAPLLNAGNCLLILGTLDAPSTAPPGRVCLLADAPVGDGIVYLRTREVSYYRSRVPIYDDDGNLIDCGSWSGWYVESDSTWHSGSFRLNVLYTDALSVKNPGDGKSLKLDWSGIAPGGNVQSYQIWRRERPDLK